MKLLRELAPGLLLVVALSILASAVATAEERLLSQALVERLVLALLFGVVARNLLPKPAPFAPGAAYAASTLLAWGVGLLGASVDLRQILAAGPALVVLVLVGVGSGLIVSYLLGRGLGLPSKLAVLVAVGSSICGNSAIAAVAPVIRASPRDIASAIALTAVVGVCFVLALPITVGLFGLTNYQYGVLAGMSVYAVPQVVAAAFPVSQLSGEVATLVKLSRVALIGPIVLLFTLLYRTAGGRAGPAKHGWSTYLPWFILMFVALAAVRNVGLLPEAAAAIAGEISRVVTLLAMAGLGFGVDLSAVRQVGVPVSVTVVCSLLFMVGITLLLLRMGP